MEDNRKILNAVATREICLLDPSRQVAKRELFQYTLEQIREHLHSLPRKQRRALARDFVKQSLRGLNR